MDSAIRPARLRLVSGVGQTAGVSDEDREREIAEEARDAHRDWIRRLPRGSSLLWPFRQARRALAEWLGRRRRR